MKPDRLAIGHGSKIESINKIANPAASKFLEMEYKLPVCTSYRATSEFVVETCSVYKLDRMRLNPLIFDLHKPDVRKY